MAVRSRATFQHEALLYAGDDEFVAGTVPFVNEGLEADEPVLVVVGPAKIDLLRAELDGGTELVHFVDMNDIGTNPACIIPAWQHFVAEQCSPHRSVRGIGEPVSPERSPAELAECHRHEALLNLAFAGAPAWRLLCPYDTGALDPAVIDEARHNHPWIVEDGVAHESAAYRGLEDAAAPFDAPLPEPAVPPDALPFADGSLRDVRSFVVTHAARAGLSPRRTHDLVLAVNEIATNSVRHGGGRGTLRAWRDGDTLVCDVSDAGRIDDPLAGRERPETGREGGRGLWLANQLCDLVQVRTFATGTVVRLHVRVASGS